MRIYHESERFLKDILENKEYAVVFDFPVVIDIGANIGTFSLFVYDFAKEIYAIEPSKENLACLKATIKENKLTKIKTYKEVIANNTGTRQVRMAGAHHYGAWNISDLSGGPNETLRIDSITLSDFMARERIDYADLVKIDVEGAEGEILTDPMFPFKKIRMVIGELHTNWASGENKDMLEVIFQDNGFVWEDYKENHFIARKL